MSNDTIKKTDGTGHRLRLKKRFMDSYGDNLADYELLELLLTYALPRRDVKPLAKALLQRFGSYQQVISADSVDLQNIPFITEHTVVLLKLIEASSKRLLRDKIFQSNHVIKDWETLVDYITIALRHEKDEQLRVLYLNSKSRLLDDVLQHQGTVNAISFYPRDIIKTALELGATSVIMVHNHPSGDPKPSAEDIDLTIKLRTALDAMEIHLHDHLIVGKSNYISFKKRGII